MAQADDSPGPYLVLRHGFLNLAFVLSVEHLHLSRPPAVASAGFLLGAMSMPLVCFLSAWRPSFRRFFFIPVASLIVEACDFSCWGYGDEIGLIANERRTGVRSRADAARYDVARFVERGRSSRRCRVWGS